LISDAVVDSVPVVLINPAVDSINLALNISQGSLDRLTIFNVSDNIMGNVDKLLRCLVDLITDQRIVSSDEAIKAVLNSLNDGSGVIFDGIPSGENLNKSGS
jgi:hypothetical protein